MTATAPALPAYTRGPETLIRTASHSATCVERPGTPLNTYYVRAISAQAITDAITAAAAKVARRVPALVVHTYVDPYTRPDGSDPLWCETHRTFGCTMNQGAPDWEIHAPCWEHPAAAVVIEIHAEGLPFFDGEWSVAGVLTLDDSGVVAAHTVGNHDNARFAADHRDLMGQCAHCNKIRARAMTILLVSDETGEVRPVGKTCLTEYTGGAIRAELLPVLTSLAERFNEAAGVALAEQCTAPTVDVVALAIRYIALDGFIGSRDDYKGTPTARQIRGALSHTNDVRRPAVLVSDLTDGDRAAARAAIATVLDGESDGSEFADNLRAAAAVDWTVWTGRLNKVGTLAYLPVAAARLAEKAARAAAPARVNAHIGTEKQRREFTGRIIVDRVVDGFMPGTHANMLIIDTDEGTLKFVGTISGPVEMPADSAVGRTITLTGTIAGHTDYQGHRQTRINRIKVTALSD